MNRNDNREIDSFCTNYLRRVYDYYGRTGIKSEIPFYMNMHNKGLWHYYSDNKMVTLDNLRSRGYM